MVNAKAHNVPVLEGACQTKKGFDFNDSQLKWTILPRDNGDIGHSLQPLMVRTRSTSVLEPSDGDLRCRPSYLAFHCQGTRTKFKLNVNTLLSNGARDASQPLLALIYLAARCAKAFSRTSSTQCLDDNWIHFPWLSCLWISQSGSSDGDVHIGVISSGGSAHHADERADERPSISGLKVCKPLQCASCYGPLSYMLGLPLPPTLNVEDRRSRSIYRRNTITLTASNQVTGPCADPRARLNRLGHMPYRASTRCSRCQKRPSS